MGYRRNAALLAHTGVETDLSVPSYEEEEIPTEGLLLLEEEIDSLIQGVEEAIDQLILRD